MSEQNKDQDQEILRQYLDSIKEEEEHKKVQYLARLSRLNIGIAVFLSLLIPIGGWWILLYPTVESISMAYVWWGFNRGSSCWKFS
jgi:hypothetical protein